MLYNDVVLDFYVFGFFFFSFYYFAHNLCKAVSFFKIIDGYLYSVDNASLRQISIL